MKERSRGGGEREKERERKRREEDNKKILFMPRKLPFCVKRPIHKISCGARFTVAVTKKGEVWSGGAGECGQLGPGRCTYQEIRLIRGIG